MYIQALVGLTQLCILTQPSLASFPGPSEKLPLTIDTWEIFFCKLSLIPSFFLLPSFIPQSILLSPHPLQAVNLSASFYLSYCKVLFECIYIFYYIFYVASLYIVYIPRDISKVEERERIPSILKASSIKPFCFCLLHTVILRSVLCCCADMKSMYPTATWAASHIQFSTLSLVGTQAAS